MSKPQSTALKLFLIVGTVAMGGLLFGFDTAVISGVTGALTQVYALSETMLGVTVSIALVGTILGAMSAGWFGDRYGRRDSLKVTAALFLISAVGCALAWNLPCLLVARFIGGLGIGAASVLAPIYIAEVSPTRLRGRFVATFQANVVGGIMVAYFSNWLIGLLGLDINLEWRVKLGVLALPALLFLIGLFTVPRSPRWLAKVGLREEALETLRTIGEPDPQRELADIEASFASARRDQKSAHLFQRKYAYPIFLAFSIAAFNQLVGINGLLYYLNDIFEAAHFDKSSGDLSAVLVGATLFVFTLIAMTMIDKLGRKFLMLMGSVGTAVSMGGVAWIFHTGAHQNLLIYFLIGYIAFFAFSQGTVIWVYVSEVFPTAVRGKGQSLGSFTHWGFCALVSLIFPMVAATSKSLPFMFFTAMCVLQFLVVLFCFVETKNVPLEEMEKRLNIR